MEGKGASEGANQCKAIFFFLQFTHSTKLKTRRNCKSKWNQFENPGLKMAQVGTTAFSKVYGNKTSIKNAVMTAVRMISDIQYCSLKQVSHTN